MDDGYSLGELLLRTYHGRCGHRRQDGLPCATPFCKEGELLCFEMSSALERVVAKFGDEEHYIWRRFR